MLFYLVPEETLWSKHEINRINKGQGDPNRVSNYASDRAHIDFNAFGIGLGF